MSIKRIARRFVFRVLGLSFFSSEFNEEIEEDRATEDDKKDIEPTKEQNDQFVEECHMEWVSTIEDVRC